MASANRKHPVSGLQGEADGSGANSELPRDMVGENEILSNRDHSLHDEKRGFDGDQFRSDQRRVHAGNPEA